MDYTLFSVLKNGIQACTSTNVPMTCNRSNDTYFFYDNQDISCCIMDFYEFARYFIFVSIGVVGFLLLLVLLLLVLILCQRLKLRKLKGRRKIFDLSKMARDDGVEIQDKGEVTLKKASGTAHTDISQERGGGGGAEETVVQKHSEVSTSNFTDDSRNRLRAEQAQDDSTSYPTLHDYSTLDEILNTIPRNPGDGKVNVIIVTQDRASQDQNTTAAAATPTLDSEVKGSDDGMGKVPVYSVVNKLKKKPKSTSDLPTVEDIDSPVSAPGPGETWSHGNRGLVFDDSWKPVTVPPPPIPPRTYEMNQLKGDAGKEAAESSETASGGMEKDPSATDGNTTSAAGPDVVGSGEFDQLQPKFTIQSPPMTGNNRHSYESVDLTFPAPASSSGGGGGGEGNTDM